MFGDHSKNPMNWKKCPVIEEADCMVPGRDKPKSFTGNIPWITIDDLNVLNRTRISKKGLGLTVEEINEVKRETIPEKSVIMSCVGNLGICSIADVPMIINQQLHSFQCKSNLIPEFLMYCLTYQKPYMESKANFTTVAYMNKTTCNSIPIIVPPLELQNDFATFVQQIDKSKFEMAIYEKLWYNYQIWRKKMGLFRGILDLFSTWTISDKFGLGAGFLYADYAWEKANERELNKMKAGVTQTITNYINENRKLLNDDLIQILNTFINSIANCNKFNANSILSELKNFLMHKCAYHSCIIEILNHSIEAIESIPEDNLDDGVKIKALQKTKNVIDCSDSNQLPILLKDLFSFYDENGIEVENTEELFDKFESLRKEYLA